MTTQTPLPDASVAARTSDLAPRVISALVMALVILIADWAGGWPFRAIWAVVGGVVAYEWLTIIRQPRHVAIIAAAAMAVIGLLGGVLPAAAMTGLLAGGAGLAWLLGGRVAMAPAGFLYAAVIALAPAALRDLPEIGPWLIIWSFAVVWFSDIAAYFTGRALGGPRLMPRVSPRKTWSGAIGGLVAGVAGALVVDAVARSMGVPVPVSVAMVGLISLVATILGQMGDLAESALKRHYDVKDSSQIIPGHGGFMDRLDAYWPVVALAGAILLLAR